MTVLLVLVQMHREDTVMNKFEKEVELLDKFFKEWEMYDTEINTVSNTTMVVNVWFQSGTVKRVLADLKNEKVFVLEQFEESEEEFTSRLVG